MSERVEVTQLQELQRRGVISPDEYAAALATLLSGDEMSHELARALRQQSATEQLDQEWLAEREQYIVKGRYNSRFIPTRSNSVLSAGFIVAVGIVWAVLGSRQGPGLAGFNLAPLIGGITALAGIIAGCTWYAKACGLEEAQRAYLERRERVEEGSGDKELS
jgi:hypothetical protein